MTPNFYKQSTDPNIRAWFQHWTKTPDDHSCHLTLHVKYLALQDDTGFLRQQRHMPPQKTYLLAFTTYKTGVFSGINFIL